MGFIVLFVIGGMIYGILAGLWEEKPQPADSPAQGGAKNYTQIEVDEAVRLYEEMLFSIDELPLSEEEKDHHRRQAKRRMQKQIRWVMTGGGED